MKSEYLLSKLQANTRDYERPYRQLEEECAEATSIRLKLEVQLTSKLKELAGIQLEEGAQVGVDVARQLELRIAEEQSMRDQLGRVEGDISTAMAAASSLAEQYGAAQKVAETMLAADGEYMRRLHAYQADNADLERRKSLQAEVQDECARKLPAFTQNRLYAYLKERQYGTPDYTGAGVLRLADAWIARQCNFRQNQGNEQMLLAMRTEAAKRAGEGVQRLQAEQAWLNDQVRSVAVTCGAVAIERELFEQREAVTQGKKRANDIHTTLAEYAERRDARYGKAQAMLVQELQGHDVSTLIECARQTASSDDDALVEVIIDLRDRLAKHDAKYAAKLEQRAAAEADYDKAKVLEREMRQSKFAGSRYQYGSGLNLESLIVGYMAGSMNSSEVAKEVRAHQEIVDDAPLILGSGFSESSRTWPSSSWTNSSSPSRSSSSSNDDDDRQRSSSSSSSSWSSSSSSDSSPSYSTSGDSGGSSYSTSDSF
ncbi:hypothetical protein [Pseudoduganella sp. R-34]|uniref:hypothetical protein n=1 Tax=Pseudoduganella sp. R-34 TaxID=3404062 RepID=UPI003CF509D0